MFDVIRKEIAEEYAQPHDKPWIVGFSGGKDSTLVAHLVVEHLLSIPRSDRTRTVHIVILVSFLLRIRSWWTGQVRPEWRREGV